MVKMGKVYYASLLLEAYVYADSAEDAREGAWDYWSDNYSNFVNFRYVNAEQDPDVDREDCDRDVSNDEDDS